MRVNNKTLMILFLAMAIGVFNVGCVRLGRPVPPRRHRVPPPSTKTKDMPSTPSTTSESKAKSKPKLAGPNKAISMCPEGMADIGIACIDIYEYPNKFGEMPVRGVSWYEAKALCEKIGKRLCSEEEWETACRGPERLSYPYGKEFNPNACRTYLYPEDGPVPSVKYPKCRSFYGVYDLSGNVSEWVEDWTDPDEMTKKKVKGGAWYFLNYYTHCGTHSSIEPKAKLDYIGFRCCKDYER